MSDHLPVNEPLRTEEEVQALRQRVATAEIALMMFLAEKPRIDPYKMLQAYLMTYPEPIATQTGVELCVAAKERGEAKAGGSTSDH